MNSRQLGQKFVAAIELFVNRTALFVCVGITLAGALVTGAGVLTLGWQLLTWLREGHWFPIDLVYALASNKLPYPRVEWLGVQKIIDWFLQDVPMSFFLFILGLI